MPPVEPTPTNSDPAASADSTPGMAPPASNIAADTPSPAAVQSMGGSVVAPTVSNPDRPVAPTPVSSAGTSSPPTVASGSAHAAPTSSTFTPGQPTKGGSKKRARLIAAVIALVVILGGGYVFAFYLPNTPSHIYASGLDRTAQGYDKLVEYTKTAQTKQFKSSKLSGDFKFVSSAVSGDGTFSGQSDDKDATGTLNVNIASVKAGINFRSVTASGQDTPDVYFQVNGVKSILNGYGLNQFASLDGQWISVDHTLLESAAASAAGDSKSNGLKSPTSAQVQDALTRAGQVNRQYLFNAKADKAVLKQEKYLGKSMVNGRQVYGYQVGYDKAHLKDYIKAMQSAVNDSSLNAWIKATTGKSASQADLSSLIDSIDKADGNYSFTMYVDAKTKLIDVLRFKDPKTSDYFEIGQAYSGGSVYPFSFKYVSTSDPQDAGTIELTAKLDSAANTVTFGANLDAKESGSPLTFKLDAEVTMDNDTIHVTAPAGAKSVMEIYQQLGLDSFVGATGIPSSATDGSMLPDFTLTQ